MTFNEAIAIGNEGKAALIVAETKAQALEIIKIYGGKMGYWPFIKFAVLNRAPEVAFRVYNK